MVSIIEAEDRAAGSLWLEWKPDSWYIHEVQILPEFQGKGLGTAVVQAVLEQGARRTLPVTLSVVPANPRAKRLYERLGFEVTSVEPPLIRMRHQALPASRPSTTRLDSRPADQRLQPTEAGEHEVE